MLCIKGIYIIGLKIHYTFNVFLNFFIFYYLIYEVMLCLCKE